MMHYVLSMGRLWRVSDRGMRHLRTALNNGTEYDLDELGTYLGKYITLADLEEDARELNKPERWLGCLRGADT